MALTIEDLKLLKEQYIAELRSAEAKIVVISDLIKIAEEKEINEAVDDEVVVDENSIVEEV